MHLLPRCELPVLLGPRLRLIAQRPYVGCGTICCSRWLARCAARCILHASSSYPFCRVCIIADQRIPAELGTAHAGGTRDIKSKDYNSTLSQDAIDDSTCVRKGSTPIHVRGSNSGIPMFCVDIIETTRATSSMTDRTIRDGSRAASGISTERAVSIKSICRQSYDSTATGTCISAEPIAHFFSS